MLHKLSIIMAIFLGLSFASKSQKLNALISEVFFKSHFSKQDTSIISFFRNNSDLKFEEQNGWTSYGPETKENDTPRIYNFQFIDNFLFNSSFSKGGITVITRKTNEGEFLNEVGLGISTFDITFGDSVYKSLDKLFAKYSSKRWVKKDLDKSWTMISYLNANKTKKVVLTRHKSILNPAEPGVGISIIAYYIN